MPLRTEEHRIGLIGLFGSGKTVLLTSLINHLEAHHPSRFTLSDDGSVCITGFRSFSPGNGWKPRRGWEYFHYFRSRDGLVDGEFPEKTGRPAEFVCQFGRSDRQWKDYRLRFFDLPGERLADAAIAAKSFADWSDHMLWSLKSNKHCHEAVEPFLELTRRDNPAEDELIPEYRRTLGRLIGSFKPCISPSTFLLDPEGGQARPGSPEEMADTRHVGLPGREFAPLPDSLRSSSPELTSRFDAHYRAYRREIVQPIFSELLRCHSLVVLVDVLTVLAGSPGMYNDIQQMLSSLLNVLRPGNHLGRRILSMSGSVLPVGWRPGGITQIAFVAPMVDRTASEADRSNTKQLLEDMLSQSTRTYRGLDAIFETCSAVRSTEIIDPENRRLRGRLYNGEGQQSGQNGGPQPGNSVGNDRQEYTASAVPEVWPRVWPPPQHSFPFVHPQMPAVLDCPPEQVNLDRIFRFLMNWKA